MDESNNITDLGDHVGHDVSIVTYGPEDGQGMNVWNIALECNDCMAVIMDYDLSGTD